MGRSSNIFLQSVTRAARLSHSFPMPMLLQFKYGISSSISVRVLTCISYYISLWVHIYWHGFHSDFSLHHDLSKNGFFLCDAVLLVHYCSLVQICVGGRVEGAEGLPLEKYEIPLGSRDAT
jgi:hypothetical protein